MSSPFDLAEGSFLVLTNARGEHSLWPELTGQPAGWERVYGPADRASCLRYVAANWTDQRSRPAGRSEAIPLSANQEFLVTFDRGMRNGAFGERHTLVAGWRVTGPVDLDLLRGALDDVVARHEVLRTSLVRGEQGGRQVIHPAGSTRLVRRELAGTDPADRDRRAEDLLNEIDAEPFPVGEMPLLWAVLGRFDESDSVLILASHHMATDAWSMGVILRDLAACYTARLAGRPAGLAEVVQYQEFASWQRSHAGSAVESKHIGYWREKLSGAAMLAIPTDRPLPADEPDAYAAQRFVIDAEHSAAVLPYARSRRSSPFMVLLAAYHVQLRELTGVTDIVSPTFTFGRYHDRFTDTVGPFFNMLPLRTDLTGCRSFSDVLEVARTTCAEAYSHDIPFPTIAREVPEITVAFGEGGKVVAAFELLQHPPSADGARFGEATCTAIRLRRLSQAVSSGIPDGALWALDLLPSGGIAGSLKYNRNTFDDSTIAGMVDGFRNTLRKALASPDSPLAPL